MTRIQIYIIWKDKFHREYFKGLRSFKRGKGYNCLKGLEKGFMKEVEKKWKVDKPQEGAMWHR